MTRWVFTFFFMVSCQFIVYPSLSQKLSGKLLMSEISPGIVRFNSTVNGTCKVTDGLDSSFNISQLRIMSNDGTPLPLEHTWISSDHTIQFVIPSIQKSQFGLYKCTYNDSGSILFVAVKYIHVLAELLEVESLHFVVDNWESYNITMVPSLQEQDYHTHDQRDSFTHLHTKVNYDYTNNCRNLDQCCNYSCNCNDNEDCKCNYNDRPGLSDVTTCFGVKIWSEELGEPETYDKIFQVNLNDYVKPSPVDIRTIKLEIINSTSLNISWLEDGMWSFRGNRRVQYNVFFEATNFQHVVNISNLRQPFLTQTDLIPHGSYRVSVFVRPLNLGIPSDAAVTGLTMPASVPSRNPSFIGYSMVNHDAIKTVTLYWESLSEKEKHGLEVKTEVELDGQPFFATFEESSCTGDIPGQKNYSVARIFSKSMSLGRNTSAPISAMKIAGTVRDSPQLNLEVSRTTLGVYNMTFHAPNGKNVQLNASVVMCEKDAKENTCSTKTQLDILRNVNTTGFGTFSLSARNGVDPYKIGVILSGSLYWNLIEWSPCIFEQGRVPSRPSVSLGKPLPPEELMIHVAKYSCSKDTGTSVKVLKITGYYCRASRDKPGCIGKTTDIEILNPGEWTTYDVDAGLYRVSLKAVADDGTKSPEWTDSVDVPKKGINVMYIIAGLCGVAICLLFIIGKLVHWREEQKHSPLSIVQPSTPKNPITFDEATERTSAPPSPINRCHLPPRPEPPSHVVPSRNKISHNPPKSRKASHNDRDIYARVVMRNNQDCSEADDSNHSGDEESCSSGTYTPDTSCTSGFGSGRSNQPFEIPANFTNGEYPGREGETGKNREQKISGVLEDGLESAYAKSQCSLMKLTDEFPVQCFEEPQGDPKAASNQNNCDNDPFLRPPPAQVYPGDSGGNRIPYKRSASGTSGESLPGASGEPTTGNSGASNKPTSYVKVTFRNPIYENNAQASDTASTCLPILDDLFRGLGEET
ncbi:uncharacterized protein LOC135486571 isoform X2 [Lineus longissimus]|uniref:uncharacterized protein LOC135486571 isoform X2 n=1 Tax=Lineus longissimus TaxID=88925 RepID=UPI00315CE0A1